ncbi:MAG: hypothetical protein IT464_06405 [Planctomycetes bacterium]|nr:hypothetical protein [Planctomycetota bacterium]
MEPEAWTSVGTPLIEQDAEYLESLISAHGYPTRVRELSESPQAELGRSFAVQVKAMHHRFALEIRANEFPEPGDKQSEERAEVADARTGKRLRVAKPLGAAVVGVLAGMRVGAKLRGGALATIGVGALLGLICAVAVIFMGGSESKPGETAEVAKDDQKHNPKR